ncbi:CD48 antigen [Limanda limanda]|uniref:CD48 antigen n=1 Tax=Limanda limanda TaxID=27771 RepID=UPI0029C8913A|nr:CD48 antigen [Limanda limanda]
MSLLIVLVLFLQAVGALPPDEVIGYLGETVTLPSGADPSRNLTTIEWSIFSNTTWIATRRGKVTKIERIPRFKGRLSLNITSGDLTIRNLRKEDEMKYTVNLDPKQEAKGIRLIIKQHLQKPTIETLFRSAKEGGCWLGLRCSSQDEDVDFSWKIEPPTDPRQTQRERGDIFTFLTNTTTDVQFTCSTSRTKENVSSTFTLKSDKVPTGEARKPLPRNRCTLGFPICFALGFAIPVVLYMCRENISTSC